MGETPNLRYFKVHPSCSMCGKKSAGILFGSRNDSYGDHCQKCADRRLKESKLVREMESQS